MTDHNPLYLLELDGNNTPEVLHSVKTLGINELSAGNTCYSITNSIINLNLN